MPTIFLNTNVIIRYLTQDDPQKAEQARELIQKLRVGTATATTCEGVIVEIVQVLESKRLYNLPRAEIRTHVRNVLGLRGLKLPLKRTYLRALDVYATTPVLDFVDALEVAHMERLKLTTLVSFDRGFDRIPGIRRVEPDADLA